MSPLLTANAAFVFRALGLFVGSAPCRAWYASAYLERERPADFLANGS